MGSSVFGRWNGSIPKGLKNSPSGTGNRLSRSVVSGQPASTRTSEGQRARTGRDFGQHDRGAGDRHAVDQ